MIMKFKIAAIAACLFLLSACERRVRAQEEMTWFCMPERDIQGAQWVEFRFVKNPTHFVTEVGPRLCDNLKSLGRPTVKMNFDLVGDFISGVRGHSSLDIEGLRGNGPGVNPLETDYKKGLSAR